jgi:hypothetical protein
LVLGNERGLQVRLHLFADAVSQGKLASPPSQNSPSTWKNGGGLQVRLLRWRCCQSILMWCHQQQQQQHQQQQLQRCLIHAFQVSRLPL